MLKTVYSTSGMMVAPHHLAAQAGRDVLAEGGNAIEAMVSAAATIAAVYPHMNSIGGDGFWLIKKPGQEPIAIDASGPAAAGATLDYYAGHESIPQRGPLAALTTAGTISGWQEALKVSAEIGGRLPLTRLLSPAISHARNGIVVTESQARLTAEKLSQLKDVPGFQDHFMSNGMLPDVGSLMRQSKLADTLERLSRAGLDDFYRGEIAAAIGDEFARLGSPLRSSDLNAYQADQVAALSVKLQGSTVYNLPPPTQGLASLMILGIVDKLGLKSVDDFEYMHTLIEATKRAFRVRDRVVTDPGRVPQNPMDFLKTDVLKQLSEEIDPSTALPWPDPAQPGDTIWMGCIDNEGVAVSFIQSIYWEFGSGVVLQDTGINWQNRGISFSLTPSDLQVLEPGRKPFHTLNPAMAAFEDGRVMTYGTMGGEGQPQTQAAVFSRYAMCHRPLQEAITSARWLLGRTWGDETTTLKLENRFSPALVNQLQEAGHVVEVLDEAFSDTMGHAGAIVKRPDGVYEGAADPRSDGAVAAL